MSSLDAGVNISGADASVSRGAMAPRRRRLRIGSIFGGFLLTGFFLALSAATFPLVAVYSFIWWAQH